MLNLTTFIVNNMGTFYSITVTIYSAYYDYLIHK